MNERIRELAEQATVLSYRQYIDSGDHRFVQNGDAVQKFAELIVRECFDVVIADGRFHDAKGVIRAGKGVAMEHFGVEE
jgi:hypothetical protein